MTDENKKILIVEDDALTLQVLSDVFRKENFFVMEAISGEEAIDTALRECPSFILLDIVLPEMDGIKVLERLRKTGCCTKVPIIVMTNLEGSSEVDRALEAGECDFIIKTDWVVSDIVKRVKKHLNT